MIKLITIILLLFTSQANATIRASIGTSYSIEDRKNTEKTYAKNINLNLHYFFDNGVNFSAGTNRVLNQESKLKLDQLDTFNKVYIDTLLIGYKINRLNTSFAIANVNSKTSFSKNSAIVPAINISYFLSSFDKVILVPSVTFYRSKELDITKGIALNINLMF